MKKAWLVILAFVLVFSGLGVTKLQEASAHTGLAGGTYKIQAVHSGKVLDVLDTAAGNPVIQEDNLTGVAYQNWEIVEVSS